jgi:hypothetical protein
MRSYLHAAALVLPWFAAVGCNDGPWLVPVKGTATRGGEPIASLTILFCPVDNSNPCHARTDAKGHFEISFNRQTKGAVRGPNKVVVGFRPRDLAEEMKLRAGETICFHPDQVAILKKYGNLETTPLIINVIKAETDLQIRLD